MAFRLILFSELTSIIIYIYIYYIYIYILLRMSEKDTKSEEHLLTPNTLVSGLWPKILHGTKHTRVVRVSMHTYAGTWKFNDY